MVQNKSKVIKLFTRQKQMLVSRQIYQEKWKLLLIKPYLFYFYNGFWPNTGMAPGAGTVSHSTILLVQPSLRTARQQLHWVDKGTLRTSSFPCDPVAHAHLISGTLLTTVPETTIAVPSTPHMWLKENFNSTDGFGHLRYKPKNKPTNNAIGKEQNRALSLVQS